MKFVLARQRAHHCCRVEVWQTNDKRRLHESNVFLSQLVVISRCFVSVARQSIYVGSGQTARVHLTETLGQVQECLERTYSRRTLSRRQIIFNRKPIVFSPKTKKDLWVRIREDHSSHLARPSSRWRARTGIPEGSHKKERIEWNIVTWRRVGIMWLMWRCGFHIHEWLEIV